MWFVVALIVGGLVAWLVLWLRSSGIKVAWYEWLIGAIGLALLLLTFQNFFGSMAEWENTAATMFLLILGLPALILLAVAWQLVARRNKA